MAGAPRFFHIGYQRTGSTYLQQVVFPAFGDYIHHRSTGSFFANADEFALGPDHYLAMSPAPVTAPVIIESHNGMSGDTLDDRPEVAARIKAICPDARIMLGLRSQLTIMPSFHFLHVKGGASCTYGQYVELAIARRKFDFHRLVRTYTETFGAESLLIMFHEDLVRDRIGYVERVREFLEIPAGARRTIGNEVRKERPSDLAIRIMSATNGVMCGSLFRRSSSLLPRPRHLRLRRRLNGYAGLLAGLAPKSVQAAARIDAEAEVPIIEAAYGESNRALFGLLGRDIDDYPYPGAGGGATATDSPTREAGH